MIADTVYILGGLAIALLVALLCSDKGEGS